MLFAAALSAAAYLYFAWRPPMQVLRGTEPISAWVPPSYQAAVFPAFAWFLGTLFLGPPFRLSRGERAGRALLIGLTGGLSCIRLLGALPLSGHALFLSAAAVFGLCRSSHARARAHIDTPGYLLATLGLGLTAYYKFALWHDELYGALSIAVGAGVGAAAAALVPRFERVLSNTRSP